MLIFTDLVEVTLLNDQEREEIDFLNHQNHRKIVKENTTVFFVSTKVFEAFQDRFVTV